MSGPALSSDGRAVKANHEPSGENAADSPTILTPDTIASVATADGTADRCGVGVGLTGGGGLTEGLGTTVGIAVPTALDAAGVALGEAGGAVTTGVAVGATAGVGLEDGDAV